MTHRRRFSTCAVALSIDPNFPASGTHAETLKHVFDTGGEAGRRPRARAGTGPELEAVRCGYFVVSVQILAMWCRRMGRPTACMPQRQLRSNV